MTLEKFDLKKKQVLIIEPKLSHWTTVEPIVNLFLAAGWNVSVYAPAQINKIILTYLNSDLQSKNLRLLDDSVLNMIKLFFRYILKES